MQPYNEQTAALYNISPNDDWLCCQQGLALPVLPPTTPEAHYYFFTKVHKYVAQASVGGKRQLDYEAFAQE